MRTRFPQTKYSPLSYIIITINKRSIPFTTIKAWSRIESLEKEKSISLLISSSSLWLTFDSFLGHPFQSPVQSSRLKYYTPTRALSSNVLIEKQNRFLLDVISSRIRSTPSSAVAECLAPCKPKRILALPTRLHQWGIHFVTLQQPSVANPNNMGNLVMTVLTVVVIKPQTQERARNHQK